MNAKIENYVDVLFKGIPNTKKARELKEEILSNLNEHFEAHLKEGKSENQSYTESLADLGDVDELLKELEPDIELKKKIDSYRQKKAFITSISVMLYILSIVFVIGFTCIPELLDSPNEEVFCIVGVILMFVCIAVATGLLVFIHMSKPQDVADYISSNRVVNISIDDKNRIKKIAAFMKLYWMLVLIIYLFVSFTTEKWFCTWLIWVIAGAAKQAIYIFLDTSDEEIKSFN